MANDNISTTNIFRILRTCMGLSLKEMAKKCEVSAVYLGELELGKKQDLPMILFKKLLMPVGLMQKPFITS